MRNKHLHAGSHIFVEAFEQGQRHRVLDAQVFCLVIDGVAAIGILVVQVIECLCIVAGGRLVGLIDAVVVIQVEGMDEARHGHEFTFHGGIDGVLDSLLAL